MTWHKFYQCGLNLNWIPNTKIADCLSIHQSLIFSRNLLKFHSQTRFSFPRHSKPHNFFSLFISMKKLFHYAHLSILYHHAFYLIQHKFLSNKKKTIGSERKKEDFPWFPSSSSFVEYCFVHVSFFLNSKIFQL